MNESGNDILNSSRMTRCRAIAREILDEWKRTNFFNYMIGAAEPISGLPLSALRKKYFSIGIRASAHEVPFRDLIVICALVKFATMELSNKVTDAERQRAETQLALHVSDEHTLEILRLFRIYTPFDTQPILDVSLIPAC